MKFNPNDVDMTEGLITKGWYHCIITDAEEGFTKAETGRLVRVEATITQGEFKGQSFRAYIVYEHPNADAQRIGSQKLARLCFACGIQDLTDERELVNRRVMALLVPQADSTFPDCKDFKAVEDEKDERQSRFEGFDDMDSKERLSDSSDSSASRTPPPGYGLR